jgi:hypothetical protein
MTDFKNIQQNLQANAISAPAYWGYSIGRKLAEEFVAKTRPGYAHVEVYEEEEVERGGLFGLPVYSVVHFGTLDEKRPVKYLRLYRTERVPEVRLECVLMTITGSKAIVKTEVAGQRKIGSVKEFMGYNDYQVRLTGVLFSPKETFHEYPIRAVNDLRRVCEAPIAVPVVNTLLNRFGIMNLVIEDWSFPSFPGKKNVQPFELSCVSDVPFELKIKNRSDVVR